ncbi:unnamed protein product, partial [Sphagnum compactum]
MRNIVVMASKEPAATAWLSFAWLKIVSAILHLDFACMATFTGSDFIKEYYWLGFPYEDILQQLLCYHGIVMSMSTLLRRLKDLGLRRRGKRYNAADIWNALQQELRGPGRYGGYRSMCRLLRTRHHIQVPFETVRLLLLQIDPASVASRTRRRLHRRTYRSRGPNDTWHVDGYDKLSMYGFGISG